MKIEGMALAYSWVEQAILLNIDEEIYIPVSNKGEQKSLCREINKAIKQYSIVDRAMASRIEAISTFKDGQLWIKLSLKKTSPLVGFKKLKDGSIKRVTLPEEEDRIRKIKLMIQDGKDKEEILSSIYVSKEEERRFFGE